MDILNTLKSKHRTEWRESLWLEIVDHLLTTKSKKDFKQVLGKLLSEDEKQTIINRVAILALVRSGKSYSEIGNLLWVSPVTISTVKKNFWDKSGHYKNCRLVKNQKITKEGWSASVAQKSSWEKLFQSVDLWELIKNPPRPPGIGIKGH